MAQPKSKFEIFTGEVDAQLIIDGESKGTQIKATWAWEKSWGIHIPDPSELMDRVNQTLTGISKRLIPNTTDFRLPEGSRGPGPQPAAQASEIGAWGRIGVGIQYLTPDQQARLAQLNPDQASVTFHLNPNLQASPLIAASSLNLTPHLPDQSPGFGVGPGYVDLVKPSGWLTLGAGIAPIRVVPPLGLSIKGNQEPSETES